MTTAPTLEPITITMPPLHPSQREVQRHDARFKVVCCGRRWGKTMLGIAVCLEAALKGGRVWWVAPSYKQALEGWAYLQRLVVQMPASIGKTHVSELVVNFASGGSVQVRTGDNPDNLRGAGLDGVVLDEAATMKPDVWELVLRPALADRKGWALFISTPQHFNWFYDLFETGQDPANADWQSWQHPTWDNPYIDQAEIDAAQRDMEPGDFDQEFGASFTAIGGAVFPLLGLNRPMYLRPMPQGLDFRRKGVGMDWGTTEAHNAAVVSGGVLGSGVVWITSSWLSASGSANDWNDEAVRCKRDYGATFARVDRSQSSDIDALKAKGFEADKGVADVEARIGNVQGLVRRQAIFFDANDAGVRELYRHMCEYHRYPENHTKAGQIVEEQDDDVDALHYLVAELIRPESHGDPGASKPRYNNDRRPVGAFNAGV